jgi:Ser/Thr protein kinase RdoA (MazF antagonist)
VHRPQGPTSAATHALLRHLEDVGFDGAPRFLGVDDQGREILSYIDGSVATGPLPESALTDQALVSVATLLRDYHTAVADFAPRSHSWPKLPPQRFQGELISHNDPNVDNIVFRDGVAIALIDFDLASPGSRIWDVAAAARHWVPLRMASDIPDSRRGRVLERFQFFVEACQLAEADRNQLVEAVRENHLWCYQTIQAGAEAGEAGYRAYWLETQPRADRTYMWYVDNADALRSAIRL